MRWLMLAALAAGCFYSPDIRDCVNTCSETQKCPDGLYCDQGFCRTPGANSMCPLPDAAPGVDRPPQMDAPVDAQGPFDADPDGGCGLACVERYQTPFC